MAIETLDESIIFKYETYTNTRLFSYIRKHTEGQLICLIDFPVIKFREIVEELYIQLF